MKQRRDMFSFGVGPRRCRTERSKSSETAIWNNVASSCDIRALSEPTEIPQIKANGLFFIFTAFVDVCEVKLTVVDLFRWINNVYWQNEFRRIGHVKS